MKSAEAALIPAAISQRINAHRKGDLTVVVQDQSGKPLSNITVEILQLRHSFLFGCNIFGLKPQDDSPEQLAYQERFKQLFNYATLPFYWAAFEPKSGQTSYERLDAMASWCQIHGIVTKGHPLVWFENYPVWAPRDADAAIPLLRRRVEEIILHYRDSIHIWDVINEATVTWLEEFDNGVSHWIQRDGPLNVVETVLSWARQAVQGIPTTQQFIYNDNKRRQATMRMLAQLNAKGTIPDIIGIQTHMHGGPIALSKIWETCEEFAQFGKPIHFTEVTVLSAESRKTDYTADHDDWITTPKGEQKQSEYVSRLYSLLFSHPAVEAITWWDLADLYAWVHAPAGLVREDFSPKPAYTALHDLIHREWWTEQAIQTDVDGIIRTRVFYGDYVLRVTASRNHVATQSFTVLRASNQRVLVRI